jgi:hypothetical protein
MEREPGLVLAPNRAVPFKPSAYVVTVAKPVPVSRREFESRLVLCEKLI